MQSRQQRVITVSKSLISHAANIMGVFGPGNERCVLDRNFIL